MARYFLLIKRKNRKNYEGIIPAKKSATKTDLMKLVKSINKGYTAKIINMEQLKRFSQSISKKLLTRKKK